MGKKNIFRCSLRLSITAVLALGFLTGCSNEEPEPEFTVIPPTPKSTQTEDPAEPDIEVDPAEKIEPPELPPEVFEETVEGAEAAARFYLDAFNYGYTTLDAAPLQKISLADCGTCQMHIDAIADMAENGETLTGGLLRGGETTGIWQTETSVIFTVSVTQEARELRGSNTQIIASEGRLEIASDIMVSFIDGFWSVSAVSNEVQT